MIIWLAVLIPIVVASFCYARFQKMILWWEFVAILVAPILFIGLSKLVIESAQTADTEYWGGHVVKAEHYEDWNERVACRHPKYRTYTDSEGHTRTEFVGFEHAYDVDYHPPYWQVIDSNGITIGVDEGRFEELAARFTNRVFVDLHRNYHSNDGDKYETVWNSKTDTMETVVTKHSYENRVQASESVFNFREIDPKESGLYEYPAIESYYRQRTILGGPIPRQNEAERRLQYWNAILGPSKKARVYILLFRDKPMQAAMDQRDYWKGGNKNEFVLCIGLNGACTETQWVYVFSWSDQELLKVEARDFVVGQKPLDLTTAVDWLGAKIGATPGVLRKDFREFSYLTVEPPTWAVVLVFVLTFVVSVGVSAWSVTNEFKEEGGIPWRLGPRLD